ncbi:hypothetical protein ABTA76_20165, partial [Acinetobacter baumannii]
MLQVAISGAGLKLALFSLHARGEELDLVGRNADRRAFMDGMRAVLRESEALSADRESEGSGDDGLTVHVNSP